MNRTFQHLLLLLTAGLSIAHDVQRVFEQVNASQINCSSEANRGRLLKCKSGDCFISERQTGRTDATLSHNEWTEMRRVMQQLAWESKLDDVQPEGMEVLVPMSELRKRLCPVRYELSVNYDTVPMLIVQARCINNLTDGDSTNGRKFCREVQHFRQVYTRMRDCRLRDDANQTLVYIKSFLNVTVNCAAYIDNLPH